MIFRRALVGALAAMAIAGLTPAIANAGTASINGGTFSYTAGAAETNQVTITGPGSADPFAADYTVVDTAGVIPGTNCSAVDANTAHCTVALGTVGSVTVSLLDLDDQVTFLAVAPNTTISGGTGNDTVNGGGGVRQVRRRHRRGHVQRRRRRGHDRLLGAQPAAHGHVRGRPGE